MTPTPRHVAFALFFLSGFCGLGYQIVWVRLAMASFGAIAPVVSVVVSVFMGGLALGSWLGGKWAGPLAARLGVAPLALYGAVEAGIAGGAVAVPALFHVGEDWLLGLGEGGSVAYLAASAGVIAAAVLPWAVLMGTTYPVMMADFARRTPAGDRRSFSYLYLGNVCGAAAGALVTAFVLIELFGFRGTLSITGAVNLAIAAVSWATAAAFPTPAPVATTDAPAEAPAPAPVGGDRWVLVCLFATGLMTLALELAWTRAFGGIMMGTVYAFATILAVYLAATAAGSAIYREGWGATVTAGGLLLWSGVASLFALVATDPALGLGGWGVGVGVAPLCGLLGFLTPKLIDQYSAGDPGRAGSAYAVNVVGCIAGPLVGSYLLLALLGERWTVVLLSLGFTALGLLAPAAARATTAGRSVAATAAAAAYCGLVAGVFTEGPPGTRKQIRTDYSGTVVSYEDGGGRHLLVNGLGMTVLTPLTKAMVHVPAAYHRDRPRAALVICFGMGTSFRSALSWDMETTMVELTPSVFDAFEYYHADAQAVRKNPLGRMVTDDGRRFLKRTPDTFDLIVIDPPPPISAAGSGMLYSVEFYREAARRLRPGGILQAWYPGGGLALFESVVRAVREVFPHAKVVLGAFGWGAHVVASMDPIPDRTADELVDRMPPKAVADFGEWFAKPESVRQMVGAMVAGARPAEAYMIPAGPPALTDDRPLNEYYLFWDRERGAHPEAVTAVPPEPPAPAGGPTPSIRP